MLRGDPLPKQWLAEKLLTSGGPRRAGIVELGPDRSRHYCILRGPRAATLPRQHEPAQVRHVRPGKVVERGPCGCQSLESLHAICAYSWM